MCPLLPQLEVLLELCILVYSQETCVPWELAEMGEKVELLVPATFSSPAPLPCLKEHSHDRGLIQFPVTSSGWVVMASVSLEFQ
jgi:hypothetical protein